MIIKKMEDGFYPALGTTTDSDGKLNVSSFKRQVELMLNASAKGVLCMGSMGKMTSIRDREYPEVARQCVETVSQKAPVMVGVMDCSVSRILDRIEALGEIKIDGVVATAPYYYKLNTNEIIKFFQMLSKRSKYPVYIYDLPSVTQSPVTFEIMEALADTSNIKGIKTGNMALILEMQRNNYRDDTFSVFYSGLDLFDVALYSGIRKNLDGMFTCTPFNSKKLYENAGRGDMGISSKYLNHILNLRNIFLKESVFSAYSYAMELLGCPGNYHSDFGLSVSDNLKEEILSYMKIINEI